MTATTPSPEAVPAAQPSWGWHLFRVSGLVLVVLLPVEVISGLLATDVGDWSAQAVADRWAEPWWRAVDWAFLMLGLLHGGMGVANLLRSAIPDARRRRPAVGIVTAALSGLGVAVTVVVFTFEI